MSHVSNQSDRQTFSQWVSHCTHSTSLGIFNPVWIQCRLCIDVLCIKLWLFGGIFLRFASFPLEHASNDGDLCTFFCTELIELHSFCTLNWIKRSWNSHPHMNEWWWMVDGDGRWRREEYIWINLLFRVIFPCNSPTVSGLYCVVVILVKWSSPARLVVMVGGWWYE